MEPGRKAAFKLMLAVVFFTLVILGGSALLLSRSPYWFFQPWTGPLARQNLKLVCALREESGAGIVIIGDSRARHGFIPAVMEEALAGAGFAGVKVMNLAVDAAQPVAMREITRRVMELPRPPRIVVLAVSAYDLNDYNTRLRRDFRLYASPGLMIRGLIFCPGGQAKLGALEGMTRGVETLIQLVSLPRLQRVCASLKLTRGGAYLYPFTPAAVSHNRNAMPWVSAASRKKAFFAEVRRWRDEYMHDFSPGGFCLAMFKEAIDFARERGAIVVVSWMPESAEFIAATGSEERERTKALYARVCKETGARFVDLGQPLYRPAGEDYFDLAAHLSPKAAARLSKDFAARELVTLFKQSRQ